MAEVAVQQQPEGPEQQKQQEQLAWWQVLASLKAGGGTAAEAGSLVVLLEQAHAAVSTDAQWSSSGVPELLRRALDMAKRGSCESARQYAINVLDFQNAASRYASQQHQAPKTTQPRASPAGPGTPNKRKLHDVHTVAAAAAINEDNKASSGSHSSSSTCSEVSSSRQAGAARPKRSSKLARSGSGTTTTSTDVPLVADISALDRLATVSSEALTPTSTFILGAAPSPSPAARSPEPPSKRRQTTPGPAQQYRRRQITSEFSPPPPSIISPQIVTAAPVRPVREGRLHMPPPQPLPLPHGPSSAAGHSSGCSSDDNTSHSRGTAARLAAPSAEWAGVLALVAEDGGRASDLCHATLQVPKHMTGFMPRSMHLTHLVQRRGVMLGHYQVVRTCIKKANMRQMSRLRSMAQHELVAVAALEHMHMVVVPYMDGKGDLKLVSFVLGTAAPPAPVSDNTEAAPAAQ